MWLSIIDSPLLCLSSRLPPSIHHYHHPQLPLSFTPGFNSSGVLFYELVSPTLFSSLITDSTDFCSYRFYWQYRFSLTFFCYYFRFICLGPCTKLNWLRELTVSFSALLNISQRIVTWMYRLPKCGRRVHRTFWRRRSNFSESYQCTGSWPKLSEFAHLCWRQWRGLCSFSSLRLSTN